MKRNQKGFSAVEGLLILVIVGLVGGVGWYVWDSSKKTNNSLDQTNSSNNVSPNLTEKEPSKPAEDTATYLVVKEWGIKAPYDPNVDTLTYTFDKNEDFGTYAGELILVRSKKYDNVSGSCRDNTIVVSRGLSSQKMGPEQEVTTTYKQAYDNWNGPPASVRTKVGNYYYLSHAQGRASCTSTPSNTSGDPQETQIHKNIVDALNKLVPA